jgi:hypothetical protein
MRLTRVVLVAFVGAAPSDRAIENSGRSNGEARRDLNTCRR